MAYDTNLLRMPDPYTIPAGPGFISVSLTDNNPGTIHELNTGGSIAVKALGSYWTMSISLPELFPDEARHILPFLSYVSSGFENFYVQLPQFKNPISGLWTTSNNTLIAKGAISIGSRADTIVIPNWSTRGGNYVAGDMLKFDNSHKIYQVVTESLVSDTKTIRLNCDILQPALVSTAGFEPNDLKFRVRCVSSITPQLTSRGLYETVSVNLRENIV